MKGTTNSIAIGAGTIPRSALAQEALYSPVESISESMDVTAAHAGKTLFVNSTGTVELNMEKAVIDALPVGTEIAVLLYSGVAQVRLRGARVIVTGETGVKGSATTHTRLQVQSPYGMLALKKVNGNTASGCIFLATGNVEVL